MRFDGLVPPITRARSSLPWGEKHPRLEVSRLAFALEFRPDRYQLVGTRSQIGPPRDRALKAISE